MAKFACLRTVQAPGPGRAQRAKDGYKGKNSVWTKRPMMSERELMFLLLPVLGKRHVWCTVPPLHIGQTLPKVTQPISPKITNRSTGKSRDRSLHQVNLSLPLKNDILWQRGAMKEIDHGHSWQINAVQSTAWFQTKALFGAAWWQPFSLADTVPFGVPLLVL